MLSLSFHANHSIRYVEKNQSLGLKVLIRYCKMFIAYLERKFLPRELNTVCVFSHNSKDSVKSKIIATFDA